MRFNLKNIILALVAAPAVLGKLDGPCTNGSNQQGVCVKKSQCVMQSGQAGSANTYKGYCPEDPADVLCCVKNVSKLTNGQTLSTTGRCKNVSQCPTSSNTIYSNQCPGGSSVKLCVPKKITTTKKTTTKKTTKTTTKKQTNFTQHEIIDISQWNTITNYSTAAKNVHGVIMRCGYRGYGSAGTLAKDNKLEDHYNGFKGKTKIGYYFFTQAKTTKEAEEEATYVVNTLLKGKTNNFPIYWDSEGSGAEGNSGRADGLSKATRTACAVAFIKKIKALGYKAGVYASEYWFKNNLDFNQIVNAGASIWVAKYSSTKPTTSQYDAWQYTSSGSIAGISGNVDRSHVYKNIAGW